jgi:hypothetical protein
MQTTKIKFTATGYVAGAIPVSDASGNLSYTKGIVPYTKTLAIDEELPYNGRIMLCRITATGAERTLTPSASFEDGSLVIIYAVGPYAVSFNGVSVGVGDKEFFLLCDDEWM